VPVDAITPTGSKSDRDPEPPTVDVSNWALILGSSGRTRTCNPPVNRIAEGRQGTPFWLTCAGLGSRQIG